MAPAGTCVLSVTSLVTQADVESRRDVLCYTGPVLEDDLEIDRLDLEIDAEPGRLVIFHNIGGKQLSTDLPGERCY